MEPPKAVKPPPRWLPGLVTALSALVNLIFTEHAGYGDPVYAAAVRSMSLSWRNFLWGALDPLGLVTVDRPPLGLWVQALFVRIFGFDPVALHMPQALAAAASCYVVYRLILRREPADPLNRWCGLLAAVALAVTPVFVAAARSTASDSLLVLLLLLAAWSVSAAADRGGPGLLLLGAALTGLGFNLGLGRALLPLPAFIAVYMLSRKASPGRLALRLPAALGVTAFFSAAWMAAVTLTPESLRPFVGGAAGQSPFSWLLSGGPGGFWGFDAAGEEAAAPGALRLLGSLWGGQIGWLLVPAALSALAALGTALVQKKDGPLRDCALWLGWLAAAWAAFSFSAGSLPVRYLALAAPAVAACCGIGFRTLFALYRDHRWAWPLLPGVLVAAGFWQTNWIRSNMTDWNPGLVFVALGVMGCGLTLALLRATPEGIFASARPWAAALSVAALLTPSAVWAATPLVYGDAWPPQAGPQLREAEAGAPLSGTDRALLDFLLASGRDGQAAVVVGGPSLGSRLLLSADLPVIIAGGPGGDDRYITPETLAEMVKNGTARYMVVDSEMRQASLLEWAGTRLEVPVSQWLGASPPAGESLPRIIDLSRPAAGSDSVD